MSRMTTVALAALLVAIPAQAAQRLPPLPEGARVRLELREPPSTWIGIALPSTPDSLVVQYPSGDVFRVSLLRLKSLHVSGGPRTRRLEGTVLGALVGFGVLLFVEGVDHSMEWCGGIFGECRDRNRGWLALGGGALGGVIGGIVGSHIKTERWVWIPLDLFLP